MMLCDSYNESGVLHQDEGQASLVDRSCEDDAVCDALLKHGMMGLSTEVLGWKAVTSGIK